MSFGNAHAFDWHSCLLPWICQETPGQGKHAPAPCLSSTGTADAFEWCRSKTEKPALRVAGAAGTRPSRHQGALGISSLSAGKGGRGDPTQAWVQTWPAALPGQLAGGKTVQAAFAWEHKEPGAVTRLRSMFMKDKVCTFSTIRDVTEELFSPPLSVLGGKYPVLGLLINQCLVSPCC